MIGNIVSGIANAVSGVIETVAGSDSLIGKVTEKLGLDDVFDMVLGGPGEWLESICDAVQMPEICGDILGCIAHIATGNIPGAIDNALSAASDIAVKCGAEKLGEFLNIAADIKDVLTTGLTSDALKNFPPDLEKLVGVLTDSAPELIGEWSDILKDAHELSKLTGTGLTQLRV